MSASLVASAVIGTHLTLSAASIATGIFTHRPICQVERQQHGTGAVAGQNCTLAASVQETVSNMYSGKGLDTTACSVDVAFEDPVALCRGIGEVQEAFRALKACSPEHVADPFIVAAQGSEPGTPAVVCLHQRYFGGLEVRGTVLVQLNDEGLITRFEERWNAAPLLDSSPVRWSRRLNGMVSSIVTPIIVRV
ncbi:hypothetical protein CYMTET_14574 [Cymbomonas tetramitiformis]|uniref:SnoaL-like domain-containing protein n=1 Tax=Cymbomonas tetramitiformis TaxID=36881 RepID=A0AAE0L9T1_9CHLO|nr:hypothetical protein CYMTET_14574 [Cymbomonas tetramitiformis]|eukprot:gene11833-13969_t